MTGPEFKFGLWNIGLSLQQVADVKQHQCTRAMVSLSLHHKRNSELSKRIRAYCTRKIKQEQKTQQLLQAA